MAQFDEYDESTDFSDSGNFKKSQLSKYTINYNVNLGKPVVITYLRLCIIIDFYALI